MDFNNPLIKRLAFSALKRTLDEKGHKSVYLIFSEDGTPTYQFFSNIAIGHVGDIESPKALIFDKEIIDIINEKDRVIEALKTMNSQMRNQLLSVTLNQNNNE